MAEEQRLRVGIVSANWSLKVHGAAWRRIPGVDVVAICTSRRETAEAAAKAHNLPKAYWDHREMFADPEIDVVDIGTRPSIRVPIVADALRAGKHVYSAIPFATNTAEANELEALCAAAGVVGVVDAQFRWVPAAQQMKAMIDAGYIGRPLGFNVQLFLPLVTKADRTYAFSAYSPSVDPYFWLAEAGTGAGGWRNFATHALLMLTHLLGPVEQIAGMTALGVPVWQIPDGTDLYPQNEDYGSATLRLQNGAIGSVQTGWCMPDTEGWRIEVWGDRGRLLLTDDSFGNGTGQVLYGGDTRLMPYGTRVCEPIAIQPRFLTPFDAEGAAQPAPFAAMDWMFATMAAAVRGQAEVSPSFAEAARVHRVVEALFVADCERRTLQVDQPD